MTIDTLTQPWIYSYVIFFRNLFVSYGLGYILVAAICYLASVQFKLSNVKRTIIYDKIGVKDRSNAILFALENHYL